MNFSFYPPQKTLSTHHSSWGPGIGCVFSVLIDFYADFNAKQVTEVKDCVTCASRVSRVIDRLIFHSTNTFCGYHKELAFRGGQRRFGTVEYYDTAYVFSELLQLMSSQGRGQGKSRQTSVENFAVTKVRSNGGINQGGRGHRCLFGTLQWVWYVSLSNILFNKYMILYSYLPYNSTLPKLLTFQ